MTGSKGAEQQKDWSWKIGAKNPRQYEEEHSRKKNPTSRAIEVLATMGGPSVYQGYALA